jgi:hypothetical protein
MKRIVVLLFISLVFAACNKTDSENWVETREITITAYKSDPENGKQYLDVIYENGTQANVRKIKVELLERTGSKTVADTMTITPTEIFKPKDRHLRKRPIGETPATFDEVSVGKVWIVK